jgi:osmotically-inducible protein OsmY
MKTILHHSDTEVRDHVMAELRFDPSINDTDIGVIVKDGAVTLNGHVATYAEKHGAVKAAKRVAGVTAIADDLAVKLRGAPPSDSDIAVAASHSLNWSSTVPKEAVKVTVQNGWVTLEGEVDFWFQRHAAEKAVRHIVGVKSIANQIQLKPQVAVGEVKASIRDAFERNALIDAGKVTVEASGHKVVLKGVVRSYAEKEEAERAARGAEGVSSVDNRLVVSFL